VSAAADIVIDVNGLTKSFDGRAVVRNLSMQVRRGTIYGFLGPNGSGKTTTIRMLCGLLTPDHGSGTCLGYDIRTEAEKIKRQVGYMTQRFSLYQDLSVRENLEFVARIYGLRDPSGAATCCFAFTPDPSCSLFPMRWTRLPKDRMTPCIWSSCIKIWVTSFSKREAC
jgi:ABC-2 type transport system ATP-binding protein